MITKEQAATLRQCISNLRSADDLVNRSHQGYTNFSAAEVTKTYEAAVHGLANFITSITEK